MTRDIRNLTREECLAHLTWLDEIEKNDPKLVRPLAKPRPLRRDEDEDSSLEIESEGDDPEGDDDATEPKDSDDDEPKDHEDDDDDEVHSVRLF
jgi:hypothetical protein